MARRADNRFNSSSRRGTERETPSIQDRSGLAIAKVIKSLRPLRSATITINGASQTFPPEIPAAQQEILTTLDIPKPGH